MKAAYTIATANYLSQAKTLADSFLAHNPDYTFYIFLLDRVNNRFDTAYFEPAQIIEIETLQIAAFDKMLFNYSIFELSNALKPYVAEYLLKQQPGIDTVLYFDCDIKVYAAFEHVEALLLANSILITPHFLTPLPLDGYALNEQSFLNSGVYNGGFFALRRSEQALTFLTWWKARLEDNCYVDFVSGLFVDQIWLNFVPLYFKEAKVVENRGYNMAYWNLHERSLTIAEGQYLVNSADPLAFFHFSGYDFHKPEIISKYQTRFSFNDRPDVAGVFQQYQQDVLGNKYATFSTLSCYYAALKKGNGLERKHIKYYLASLKRYPAKLKNKLRGFMH